MPCAAWSRDLSRDIAVTGRGERVGEHTAAAETHHTHSTLQAAPQCGRADGSGHPVSLGAKRGVTEALGPGHHVQAIPRVNGVGLAGNSPSEAIRGPSFPGGCRTRPWAGKEYPRPSLPSQKLPLEKSRLSLLPCLCRYFWGPCTGTEGSASACSCLVPRPRGKTHLAGGL